MRATAVHLGKRGVVVIPAELRRQLGLDEGALLLIERQGAGVLIRPAIAVPVTEYTPRQQAMYLLNDAFDVASYQRARAAVRELGINPDEVEHEPPDGVSRLP